MEPSKKIKVEFEWPEEKINPVENREMKSTEIFIKEEWLDTKNDIKVDYKAQIDASQLATQNATTNEFYPASLGLETEHNIKCEKLEIEENDINSCDDQIEDDSKMNEFCSESLGTETENTIKCETPEQENVNNFQQFYANQISRGCKRKIQKGIFLEENMRRAVRQVLIGEDGIKLSLRKAAARNGVAFQTLQRYVKKEQEKANPDEQISMKANYKHRLVFSEDEEKQLVKYVIICSKMCYGRTTKDTRELAYEMAKINSKNMPLSWKKNQLAGIDWLRGFLKRHNKELSIRQTDVVVGCSLSRASSFNEYYVKLFFDNLQRAYDRSKKFSDGTRIYNLDETGTSDERGVLITTCCIISAAGSALPPVMVFPRKKFKHHMLNGAPPDTLGLATPSGCMNGELFPSVMKHFIQYSGSSKETPTILIFDNHESHLTIEALSLAKENGVTIVTLPPHCSHKLQPLDTPVFALFKANYNAAIESWLLHHPGTPLSIYDVGACVGVAFERSMTPLNIKSGFKKTGIFPFDRAVSMGKLLNDDSDNDEAADLIPEVEPAEFEELDRDPEADDFVLVQFKTKNDVLYYIGKVVNLTKSSNDVEVNFLRKATKFDGHFIFPSVPDISIVPLNDIKMILSAPSVPGNTRRLQSYYKFEINLNQLSMR